MQIFEGIPPLFCLYEKSCQKSKIKLPSKRPVFRGFPIKKKLRKCLCLRKIEAIYSEVFRISVKGGFTVHAMLKSILTAKEFYKQNFFIVSRISFRLSFVCIHF